MVILDTDHVSILEWEHGDEFARLRTRLDRLLPGDVATTIVSYEEQTRGWLAYMARARKLAQQIEAYRRLHRHLNVYRAIQVCSISTSRRRSSFRVSSICEAKSAWRTSGSPPSR